MCIYIYIYTYTYTYTITITHTLNPYRNIGFLFEGRTKKHSHEKGQQPRNTTKRHKQATTDKTHVIK